MLACSEIITSHLINLLDDWTSGSAGHIPGSKSCDTRHCFHLLASGTHHVMAGLTSNTDLVYLGEDYIQIFLIFFMENLCLTSAEYLMYIVQAYFGILTIHIIYTDLLVLNLYIYL